MAKKGCTDADVETSSLWWPSDGLDYSDNQWLLPEPKKSVSKVFWAALSVSLVLHLLILQYRNPHAAQPPASAKSAASTIVLHLKQQRKSALPSADVVQQEPEQKQEQEPNIAASQEKPPSKAPTTSVAPIAADVTPATARDIQRVIQTSRYQDVVSQQGEIESADPETSNRASSGQAFNDVFDPRLRQRLQNNSTRIASVRTLELTEAVNIHGDSEVRLDSGGCMVAKADHSIGGAKDWLMTACSSGEDEGEMILRRVNESLRGRY